MGVSSMYNHYNTKSGKRQYIKQKMLDNEQWGAIYDGVPSPLIKRVTFYKFMNRRIVSALSAIGEPAKAGAINDCGTFVQVGRRNGHEIIKNANFCRQRLCQVCAWRRSAKFTAQMIPVCRNLAARGYIPIFITLTIRNPVAQDVHARMDVLMSGWDRLMKMRKYRRAVAGFVRGVEITYNTINNTYHPHIHALLFMNNGYYSSNYISHDDLMADWQSAARLDYAPSVHIQAVRPRHGDDDTTTAAVLETLKYCYKIDYNTISSDTIATILYSLQGRRLISFGGVVADERRALQMGDIDDNLAGDEPIGDDYNVLYIFSPAGWRIIDNDGFIEPNTNTGENCTGE